MRQFRIFCRFYKFFKIIFYHMKNSGAARKIGIKHPKSDRRPKQTAAKKPFRTERLSVSKKVCLQQIIQPDTLTDCQKGEMDFVFCEREPYNGTAPEQKTKSAKTAPLCGFSAFKVLHFL